MYVNANNIVNRLNNYYKCQMTLGYDVFPVVDSAMVRKLSDLLSAAGIGGIAYCLGVVHR